jgi:hypothetical protein
MISEQPLLGTSSQILNSTPFHNPQELYHVANQRYNQLKEIATTMKTIKAQREADVAAINAKCQQQEQNVRTAGLYHKNLISQLEASKQALETANCVFTKMKTEREEGQLLLANATQRSLEIHAIYVECSLKKDNLKVQCEESGQNNNNEGHSSSSSSSSSKEKGGETENTLGTSESNKRERSPSPPRPSSSSSSFFLPPPSTSSSPPSTSSSPPSSSTTTSESSTTTSTSQPVLKRPRLLKENPPPTTPTDPTRWLFEEGMDHWYGNNFKQLNPQRAIAMVEAAAMLGSPVPIALCLYRGMCDNKGDLDDMRKAFKILAALEKTDIMKNNPCHWMQWALGYVHRAGNVVPRSSEKAFDYYKSSAEQGNTNAMNTLGFFYIMGRGCEKDAAKAFEWYQKSAQLGCSSAMFNMGNRYIDGLGVASNRGQAKEWWRKAAALGHVGAQTSLDALNLCD